MKGFLKFIAIFISILLLSAVLAPILHDYLPFKFQKIFQRVVMIFSIAAALIFVRIQKETWVLYGMDWRKDSLSLLCKGVSIALTTLIVYTLVEALFGNVRWSPRDYAWHKWIYKMVSCLGTAVVVGPLEEFFFRGFIFQSVRKKIFHGAVMPAMIATSLFYSSIHFINLRRVSVGSDPNFGDSLRLIAAPIQSFADWQGVWPAAIGLFLFGMVLNYAAVRSKSLYPSIGLHAGCVLFVRVVGYFTAFLGQHEFLLGSKKVYDGVLGWLFLLGIGFLVALFIKKREDAPPLKPAV